MFRPVAVYLYFESKREFVFVFYIFYKKKSIFRKGMDFFFFDSKKSSIRYENHRRERKVAFLRKMNFPNRSKFAFFFINIKKSGVYGLWLGFSQVFLLFFVQIPLCSPVIKRVGSSFGLEQLMSKNKMKTWNNFIDFKVRKKIIKYRKKTTYNLWIQKKTLNLHTYLVGRLCLFMNKIYVSH